MSASFPRTIGRYAILDRLAVGGMAELFKAQLSGQHGFEKLVTIKKILPHLAVDRSFIEMFIDEARLTAQLDHCLLYTSPSPRDRTRSRMPSSA